MPLTGPPILKIPYPLARLALRPAHRRQKGGGHLPLRQDFIPAHDALMNDRARRPHFEHAAGHEQYVIEPRRAAILIATSATA
jgi:hypothetical protein